MSTHWAVAADSDKYIIVALHANGNPLDLSI